MRLSFPCICFFFLALSGACKRPGAVEESPVALKSHGASVNRLAVDLNGRLWVASSEADGTVQWPVYLSSLPTRFFLSTYEQGKFSVVSNNFGAVQELAIDGNNALWCLAEGLSVRRNGQVTKVYAPAVNTFLSDMAIDAENGVWAGGYGTGLIHADRQLKVTQLTRENAGLPSQSIGAVHAAPDGSVWVAFGEAKGIGRYRGGQWTFFNAGNSPVRSQVMSICTLGDRVWMAVMPDYTGSNLLSFDGKSWTAQRMNDGNGNSIDGFSQLKMKSGKNRIWMAYYPPHNQQDWRCRFMSFDGNIFNTVSEIPDNAYIGDFSIDIAGSRIWLALSDKGLFSLEEKAL